MDKKTVLEIVARFRKALEESGFCIDRIVLYGSWVTDTALESSDIDLVVISRDFAGKGLWERNEALAAAVYEVFEPIEAVAFTPEEWQRGDSMICHFARNGEVIRRVLVLSRDSLSVPLTPAQPKPRVQIRPNGICSSNISDMGKDLLINADCLLRDVLPIPCGFCK